MKGFENKFQSHFKILCMLLSYQFIQSSANFVFWESVYSFVCPFQTKIQETGRESFRFFGVDYCYFSFWKKCFLLNLSSVFSSRNILDNILDNKNETRPDTRQSSRGRLGRSSNAKIARNSKMWPTDRLKDGPTDRHGKVYHSTKKKPHPILSWWMKKWIIWTIFCWSDLKDFRIFFHSRPIPDLYLKRFRS